MDEEKEVIRGSKKSDISENERKRGTKMSEEYTRQDLGQPDFGRASAKIASNEAKSRVYSTKQQPNIQTR